MLKPGTRFGLALQLEVISSNRDAGLITYKVFCHTCAKDTELFGNGIFTTTKDRLEKFQFPCGCGSCRKWTPAQYAVKISRIAEEKFCKFLGFVTGQVNSSSKIQLECLVCSHTWNSSTIVNFIKPMGGNGCPNCATSGFKRELPATFYILAAEKAGESFTGYGITNQMERRLSTHKKNLSRSGYVLNKCVKFEMSGHRALAIEQLVPYSFPILSQTIPGFQKEAIDILSFVDLENFVATKLQISGA
jgi:hypothetical protein